MLLGLHGLSLYPGGGGGAPPNLFTLLAETEILAPAATIDFDGQLADPGLYFLDVSCNLSAGATDNLLIIPLYGGLVPAGASTSAIFGFFPGSLETLASSVQGAYYSVDFSPAVPLVEAGIYINKLESGSQQYYGRGLEWGGSALADTISEHPSIPGDFDGLRLFFQLTARTYTGGTVKLYKVDLP